MITSWVIFSAINRRPRCQEMGATHQSGIFLIMKNVSFSVVDN